MSENPTAPRRAPGDGEGALVQVRDAVKRYPGVVALAGVSVTLQRGEIHALLGENGAGKSTLIRLLSGITTPDSGEIVLDGAPVTLRRPRDAQQLGITTIHQELSLAPDLTVLENIFLGRELRSRRLGLRLLDERAMVLIPPHDLPNVMAGQGTVAMELFEDVGELDWLFVSCGGGGLLSGCAICAETVSPRCRVVGVEPDAGDDGCRSFKTRTLHTIPDPQTIADGARTPCLGRYNFPVILEHVDEMLSVPDSALVEAMKLVMERLKQVVEPTGVLALAGLAKVARERPQEIAGSRIGVILSGGNVDLDRLANLLSDGV